LRRSRRPGFPVYTEKDGKNSVWKLLDTFRKDFPREARKERVWSLDKEITYREIDPEELFMAYSWRRIKASIQKCCGTPRLSREMGTRIRFRKRDEYVNTDHKNGKNLIFFDLETKRGSAQVGWSRIASMGLSLAATYSERDGYQTFLHDQVQSLIGYLKSADAVVGFNHVEFDYKVLSAYTDDDLRTLNNIDMFLIIYNKTGRRISLDKLAQESLGRSKSGDGLDALQWYKEGRFDLIEEYCRDDVAITRDLYYWGCDKGFVSYLDQEGVINVAVDWRYSSDRLQIMEPPYKDRLERDFLQTINDLGEEFVLYDAIVKVAKYRGLFLATNSPDALSNEEKLLFKDIQNAARRLARAKCVEQTDSWSNFWRITSEGIDRLMLLQEKP